MKIKYEWEMMDESHKNFTDRAKVFGGWIVRSFTYEIAGGEDAKGTSESMVFVPDPNHEWEIE